MKAAIPFIGIIIITFILTGLAPTDPERPFPKMPDELGELLFNDPILSIDSTISCASCHRPEFAFADTSALSLGIHDQKTRRNTPSVMNTLSRSVLMWDGRAASLEDQMLLPLEHPGEMGFHRDSLVARLSDHTFYGPAFEKMFNKPVDLPLIQGVIATFQRTLETSNTPNDRWLMDMEGGLNDQQIRGRAIFFNQGNCIECHFTPDFTGDEFRNIGLFNGKDLDDEGRFETTQDSSDLGKFKVPGLRNVAVTAPYMHNGMFRTLDDVIDYYNDPDHFVPDAINRDTIITALGLSQKEKDDLKAFLEGLTDDRFISLLEARQN